MISTDVALNLILKKSILLNKAELPILDAFGYIIAKKIKSKIDYPPFDQSAMDGYGIRFSDFTKQSQINIVQELQAGRNSNKTISKNQAVRIFTGAKVPEGVDTVVMQEKTFVKNKQLIITDNELSKGNNIRKQGSQTKKGDLIINEGKKITAGVTGFLAGLGCYKVNVYKKPRVCIITTGKELVEEGGRIGGSKIYESNSFSLRSALKQQNIVDVKNFTVDDDETEIETCINENIDNCDILIVTGGVSVGDYDFVVNSFKNCGVKKIFHKVKQKPGKPMYFGKHKKTLVFGLPGNPSAVLTCFYIYVLPAILKITGSNDLNKKIKLTLANDFKKKSDLTYFLKGKISENNVIALHSQESYQMNSFADADCIIKLEENKTEYKKGEIVDVFII
ncbi:MAG: molybdopterin molybdotransferase MoeA [Bacteroidetes bacterium]|nr:molybdopterin molybdotransferase MoeA [Bacteroidota bacterium]